MTNNPFLKQSTPPWERDRPAWDPTPSTASASVSQSAPGASADLVSIEPDQAAALVAEAETLKARMDADRDRYNEIKALLWESVGRTAGTVPGTSAKFRAPAATRRKVNYSVLETKFPQAYEAAVTITANDTTTPGALYL